jgi:hypothetical protein
VYIPLPLGAVNLPCFVSVIENAALHANRQRGMRNNLSLARIKSGHRSDHIQSTTHQAPQSPTLSLHPSTPNTTMNSPSTPKSQSERAVRARLEKRFATLHAYKNNCQMPSTEAINKHVDYEMHLSKVFSLSPGFEQDVWDLVYDEGVQGASGVDKERLEALCDEWKIPEASLACRNKVKVQLCTTMYNYVQSNSETKLTDSSLDKIVQCATNTSGASQAAHTRR